MSHSSCREGRGLHGISWPNGRPPGDCGAVGNDLSIPLSLCQCHQLHTQEHWQRREVPATRLPRRQVRILVLKHASMMKSWIWTFYARHRCSNIIELFVLQRPSDPWVAPPAGGVPGYPADVWGHGLAQRPHHCQRSHRSPGDALRFPYHTGSITGQRHRPLSTSDPTLYELPSYFRSKQLQLPLFLLCFKPIRSVNGHQDGRCEGKKVEVTKTKTSKT